jgi:hypothetical protein
MAVNWVPVYGGSLPPNAVYAGNDSDGSPLYVGRAFHDGDQLPAKVIPSKQIAYVCHNGLEIPKHQYEALTGIGFTWIASSNGHVPPNAVLGGQTNTGEPLHIGRTHHQGSLTPGKIHRTHGCLYFPYGGSENSSLHYEVLCSGGRSQWVQSSAHSPCPMGAHVAGNDTDGSPIYIGRAFHEGDQIPAKVIPSKQIAYICYAGQEIPKHHFEVLCQGSVQWVHSGHGIIPHGAVPGGRTNTGETLYIGRAHYMGSLTVGKVHPSHNTLYIPFGGSEVPIRSYEILVEN